MRKVKGYTLVETLVSLTIIVMSIGIGFTIFENFMNTPSAYKKTIARNKIDQFIFSKAYQLGNEASDENIEFELTNSENWPNCQLLTVSYTINEIEIYQQKVLIEQE